jgi:peroxiredoxin
MRQQILILWVSLLWLGAFNSGNKQQNTEAPKTITTNTKNGGTNSNTHVMAAEQANALPQQLKDDYTKWGIDIAQGIPTGLPLEAPAPVFKSADLSGKDVFLPALLKKGPVVLFFYRGEWCPVCNKYLSGLQDSLPLILKKAAAVIAVSPETKENMEKTADKTHTGVTLVPDPNGMIMDAYGVSFFVTKDYQQMINEKLDADIATNNATPIARLPIPATYVIGTDGRIKYVHFNLDYHQRATAKQILAALSGL